MADDGWCPITTAAKILGDKWKLVIVARLLGGPRRFSDLLRSIEGISAKVLATNLNELRSAGLVAREVRLGPPVESWYALTEKGRDLQRVVEAIEEWGMRWLSPQRIINIETSRIGEDEEPPRESSIPHP